MKRHPLNRDDLPRYANLRAGDMYQGDAPERPRLHVRWLVTWAVGFAVAGFIAAVAFGDAPPHYEAPRGYDVCKTKGC